MLKFLRLSFYMMGKVLTGEQSCPCNRSCYIMVLLPQHQCPLLTLTYYFCSDLDITLKYSALSLLVHNFRNAPERLRLQFTMP